MRKSLAAKILEQHLADGDLRAGQEVAIRVDQTLTQDATGTMAYLQLEAMGIERVQTKLSVSYVDHNMLQAGFENADDHRYLQSVAAKYGIYFSRPGNGICHQVHLERFSAPGEVLIGSDSHTPTCGGAGMLAIGAGGLDVAAAMAGMPMWLTVPKIIGVQLKGELSPWVSAKDVIFELLRRLTVKGGVGNLIEYFGPGCPQACRFRSVRPSPTWGRNSGLPLPYSQATSEPGTTSSPRNESGVGAPWPLSQTPTMTA